MTCFVYRVHDDDGNLLYVGCSVNPAERMKAHYARHWWRDAAEVSVRQYPTRERALAVEARAIRLLVPIWNRSGVREGALRRKEAAVDGARRERILAMFGPTMEG